MTHICVNKLTIIGSNNGLSPGRRQSIIWTNAGILLIGPLGTNFNETSRIIYFIQENGFQNVVRKLTEIVSRPHCVNTICMNYWVVKLLCQSITPKLICDWMWVWKTENLLISEGMVTHFNVLAITEKCIQSYFLNYYFVSITNAFDTSMRQFKYRTSILEVSNIKP